jgi:hypothetical protein
VETSAHNGDAYPVRAKALVELHGKVAARPFFDLIEVGTYPSNAIDRPNRGSRRTCPHKIQQRFGIILLRSLKAQHLKEVIAAANFSATS